MSENYFQKFKSADPTFRVTNEEFNHSFLSICTLVCQINNKKLNLAKIFKKVDKFMEEQIIHYKFLYIGNDDVKLITSFFTSFSILVSLT